MNPSLTIAFVFASSLAIVIGHAVRVGWTAYAARHHNQPREIGSEQAVARDGRAHGEIKAIPGTAKGTAVTGGSHARQVISEAKPGSRIKTS